MLKSKLLQKIDLMEQVILLADELTEIYIWEPGKLKAKWRKLDSLLKELKK